MSNQEVTYTSFFETLAQFKRKLEPGDIFVFYFSGHGCEDNNEHYLLPHDTTNNRIRTHVGMIPLSGIKGETDWPGVQRLFILDCCKNELFAGRGMDGCPPSRDIALQQVVEPDQANLDIHPPLVMCSCSTGEKAFENIQNGHGFFTEVLINVLNDASVECFNSFKDTIGNKMRDLRIQNHLPQPQTPCLQGALNADFFLLSRWNDARRNAGSKKAEVQEFLAQFFNATPPQNLNAELALAESDFKCGRYTAAQKHWDNVLKKLESAREEYRNAALEISANVSARLAKASDYEGFKMPSECKAKADKAKAAFDTGNYPAAEKLWIEVENELQAIISDFYKKNEDNAKQHFDEVSSALANIPDTKDDWQQLLDDAQEKLNSGKYCKADAILRDLKNKITGTKYEQEIKNCRACIAFLKTKKVELPQAKICLNRAQKKIDAGNFSAIQDDLQQALAIINRELEKIITNLQEEINHLKDFLDANSTEVPAEYYILTNKDAPAHDLLFVRELEEICTVMRTCANESAKKQIQQLKKQIEELNNSEIEEVEYLLYDSKEEQDKGNFIEAQLKLQKALTILQNTPQPNADAGSSKPKEEPASPQPNANAGSSKPKDEDKWKEILFQLNQARATLQKKKIKESKDFSELYHKALCAAADTCYGSAFWAGKAALVEYKKLLIRKTPVAKLISAIVVNSILYCIFCIPVLLMQISGQLPLSLNLTILCSLSGMVIFLLPYSFNAKIFALAAGALCFKTLQQPLHNINAAYIAALALVISVIVYLLVKKDFMYHKIEAIPGKRLSILVLVLSLLLSDAFIAKKLMADRHGDMRWISDEFIELPIWENLLYPSPTIRTINITHAIALSKNLDAAGFKRCSWKEIRQLIKPFMDPDMPESFYSQDEVWSLGNNLYFRIHCDTSGTWCLYDYQFFLHKNGKSIRVETFPKPPETADAALIAGIVQNNSDCWNNLAVKYADGEMDQVFSCDDEAEPILKELVKRRHVIGTYNLAVYYQNRNQHAEAEKYFALAKEFAAKNAAPKTKP